MKGIGNNETLADICSRGTKKSIGQALDKLMAHRHAAGKPMTPERVAEFRAAIEMYSKPDLPKVGTNARVMVSRNKREGRYMGRAVRDWNVRRHERQGSHPEWMCLRWRSRWEADLGNAAYSQIALT